MGEMRLTSWHKRAAEKSRAAEKPRPAGVACTPTGPVAVQAETALSYSAFTLRLLRRSLYAAALAPVGTVEIVFKTCEAIW